MDARMRRGRDREREQLDPEYEVRYWTQPAPGFSWNLEAWDLIDCADVDEALAWARHHSQARRFQLFVVASDDGRARTLVHLSGIDPNSRPAPWPASVD
ncbi:hypothetical protein [Microbacterium sp. ZW T5_56]|uniref:hypothetical protein n=1 Tax=Microbacterium sp. ZW T5_56 TaxID=3378081 RepID=UPI003853D3A3